MSSACPHCNCLLTDAPQQPRPGQCPRCGRSIGGGPAAPAPGPAAAATSDVHTPPLATLLGPAAAQEDAIAAAGSTAPPASQIPQLTPHVPPPAARAPASAAQPAAVSAAPAGAVPRPLLAHWQWPVVALLALLLGLQVLLADRARLAADPQWRPLVEAACGVLGCSLPAWREPSAFTMLERSVRPARAAGTLQVDASFRNDARWAQPWPMLRLSLADADGRTIGSGVFAPEQYLDGAPEGLLSPGQSAHVTFVVREPAAGTVAFAFQFH